MTENLANARSTAGTPGGDPYQCKIAVLASVGAEAEPVRRIVRDISLFRVISSPSHPAADERGSLKRPNVNPTTEAARLRAAMGAYESNMKVMATLDELNRRTIDLLKI